jgi:adenine-specific DNA-methyltransferase
MPITKLTPENNYPYLQERMNALQQAVPEAFADGKINWDTLREVLGEDLEDSRDEFFGLTWPGKREARKLASTPSRGTLVPVPGEGVNEDETENLFIEGDNLEVLKLLLKSYAGKIKMIYIDPPYNTGNDFIYNDSFTDPLDAYLKYTGSKGEEGELLTTNTRADGRFHSRWLNMMYPRLILSRQMLSKEGLIFISIDENEVHNLSQMMNEIFGEENFINTLVWKKRYNAAKEQQLAIIHEYILIYSKDNEEKKEFFVSADEKYYEKMFTEADEFIGTRGKFMTQPLEAGNSMGDRPNLRFPIIAPDGTEILPRRQWVWGKEKVDWAKKNGYLKFYKNSSGEWRVRHKHYSKDENGEFKKIKPFSIYDKVYTQDGTKELEELFSIQNVFPFPKPSKLISHLIELCDCKNEIILDYFSGSATTAQAILELNKKENRNNKFILVQVPEVTGRQDFQTIAEIGKERIRKVIGAIKEENSKKKQQASFFIDDSTNTRLGFKVLQYTRSNIKQWKLTREENSRPISSLFDDLSGSLIQGWKKDELLSEIILLEGFPLTSKIEFEEEFHQNQLYKLTAPDFCAHSLFVCLDEQIHSNTVDLLKMEKEDIFICLDSALSDELKTRLQDRFNVHVI